MEKRPLVTFDDVAIYFTKEEWRYLEEWQKDLYKEVMMENYQTLQSLGKAEPLPKTPARIHPGGWNQWDFSSCTCDGVPKVIARIQNGEEPWVRGSWEIPDTDPARCKTNIDWNLLEKIPPPPWWEEPSCSQKLSFTNIRMDMCSGLRYLKEEVTEEIQNTSRVVQKGSSIIQTAFSSLSSEISKLGNMVQSLHSLLPPQELLSVSITPPQTPPVGKDMIHTQEHRVVFSPSWSWDYLISTLSPKDPHLAPITFHKRKSGSRAPNRAQPNTGKVCKSQSSRMSNVRLLKRKTPKACPLATGKGEGHTQGKI
ncbi:uncharacterized protein O3C94_006190 [Discoglossus pictus]